MNEAKKLRTKFEADLAQLQEECNHPSSLWMPFMWAPGHYGSNVLVCTRCDKILERKPFPDSGGSTIYDEGKYPVIYQSLSEKAKTEVD